MSAWGNKDDIASPGTVTLTSNSTGHFVIGTGTFFANNYTQNTQVIRIGNFGQGAILSVTNATHMTLASNTEFDRATITGANNYTVNEIPVNIVTGDATTLGNTIFGVSVAEQIVSNNLVTTTANTLAVAANTGAHAGWNKVQAAYTDTHGRLRVKTETLVAMGTITGDGDDDTLLPDS